MNSVFADAAFFVATVNERDSFHERAKQFSLEFSGLIVTSKWVLVEVANYLAKLRYRERAIVFLEDLLADPLVECLPATEIWFDSGWKLYRTRADKEWSLTDCISFEIMRQRAIQEALSSDHHFEQAGFGILLK
jgi:predicted nucleic acid-binding protein